MVLFSFILGFICFVKVLYRFYIGFPWFYMVFYGFSHGLMRLYKAVHAFSLGLIWLHMCSFAGFCFFFGLSRSRMFLQVFMWFHISFVVLFWSHIGFP